MTPEEVAARFDSRPGYRLVDYRAVGLPVYRVFALALMILKKRLDPISEFVLRCVGEGLRTPAEVSGLLGLSSRVVDGSITELVRSEHLQVNMAGPGASDLLSLCPKGRDVLFEEETVKPAEQMISFLFDGLTRRAKWYGEAELWAPRDLKNQGIAEIPAFPARGPELDELDVRDVTDVLQLEVGTRDTRRDLLRIKSVERKKRLYKDAVALAYRASDGDEVQVAFAIDGRLSLQHESCFARADGPRKTRLFREIATSGAEKELAADPLVGSVVKKFPQLQQARELQEEAARARHEVARLRAEAAEQPEHAAAALEREIPTAEEEVRRLEDRLRSLVVRPLAVYEHAPLLRRALSEAEHRLLLLSPWIRSSVVDGEFIGMLGAALKRGVRVLLGFGLGEKDEDEGPHDRRARGELEALAERYDTFTLRRLGDTHAKVLIMDRDFYVITSFNWLSFRGDPKKPFREEWGSLVAIPDQVDALFDLMEPRFRVSSETP